MSALAIALVEDHPGHGHVRHAVEAGLSGEFRLFASEMIALRARWVMTAKWKMPKLPTDRILREFLSEGRVTYVGADRQTMLRAFDLADELGHDVNDTYQLALAEANDVRGVLTTDTGLKKPCERLGLEYDNPVPASVLRRFSAFRPN